MEDRRRQQLVEQYEDAALSLLMDEYADADGARLLREFENATQNGEHAEIPDALDIKYKTQIESSLSASAASAQIKRIGSRVARVAVLVIVLLGLSSAVILSVAAFRVPVLNFLLDENGKFSILMPDFESHHEDIGQDKIIERFEMMVQSDYEIITRELSDMQSSFFCRNQEGHVISLQVDQADSAMRIDAEDLQYSKIDFGSYEALFWEKKGFHLLWLDDQEQMIYSLFANGLTEDAFWEFAYTLIA